jgi:hypothetical protein
MFQPRARYEGTGGTLHLGSITIGTLGAWGVYYFGDDKPYFRATGCTIPSRWLSAGLKRLVARPRLDAKPDLQITGDVRLLDAATVNLGNLTIEGAASDG